MLSPCWHLSLANYSLEHIYCQICYLSFVSPCVIFTQQPLPPQEETVESTHRIIILACWWKVQLFTLLLLDCVALITGTELSLMSVFLVVRSHREGQDKFGCNRLLCKCRRSFNGRALAFTLFTHKR